MSTHQELDDEWLGAVGRDYEPPVTVTENGAKKHCRDRQPWGGVTDPDRCSCVGACVYDRRDCDAP